MPFCLSLSVVLLLFLYFSVLAGISFFEFFLDLNQPCFYVVLKFWVNLSPMLLMSIDLKKYVHYHLSAKIKSFLTLALAFEP